MTHTHNTNYGHRNEQSDRLEALMAIENLSELRDQVKQLHEKCVEQQIHIKKLEFELEMEQGHVKILKHDNKLLRQMTVDMVNTTHGEQRSHRH